MPSVATITGAVVVILTVTNPERSAQWYQQLLTMHETSRYTHPDGHIGQICLTEPATGLEICFVPHANVPFDEHQTGLDHLEFLVPDRAALNEWTARLDELGIEHSGIKEPTYGRNAMITFRDPDNIQLEFFWRAPRP